MLIRELRRPGLPHPVDLRLVDGCIAELGTALPRTSGEEVLDAVGAVAIPGLWDQHVHVGQTAQGYSRWDTFAVRSVAEAVAGVREQLAARGPSGTAAEETLVGFGHRLVDLVGEPTVTALDAVSGDVPVVLIGGDAHHAWMNSAALRGLGLPPRQGIVGEDEWFAAVAHLDDLPGVAEGLESGVERLQDDALARGVVGLVDMEWAENWRLWERRHPRLRVRTATYAGDLDRIPGPSGTPVGPTGLVTMGPLKVILDGSLGSRSALCRHAYPAAVLGVQGEGADGGHGTLSMPGAELDDLLRRARSSGLDAAIHAIGDAAVGIVLEAIGRVRHEGGVPARIEHAQMLADDDVAAMARLGVVASVQPAHLLDDRDATEGLWPDTADEAFRLRDLLTAGARLVFGSDAPVAPVDPWLAMSVAVHRSGDMRPAWFPGQQLQPREALAASTEGVTGLTVGGPADLVLLEEDPFGDVPLGSDGVMDEGAAREAAAELRAVRPLATIVAGSVAFSR